MSSEHADDQILDTRSWLPDPDWSHLGCKNIDFQFFLEHVGVLAIKMLFKPLVLQQFLKQMAVAVASVVDRPPNCSNEKGRKLRCL